MKSLSGDAYRIYGQPMFKLLAKVNELEASGREILHFEIGDTDFRTPVEVVDTALQAILDGKTHYVSSLGIPELRDAVCKAIEKKLGFKPEREQILICPGNAVIYFAIRCVVDEDTEVIYPDPGFPTWLSSIALCGAKPVAARLKEENGFHLKANDVAPLINDFTRLIITHSPSNPTGAVMNRQEVEDIALLARGHDVYLLSDEAYAELVYDGAHYSPSVYDQCLERTILLGSFSKTYAMTGWRLGYAIAPVKVIEKMGLLFQMIFSCFPPFIQLAGVSALARAGYYNRKMVSELRERRDLMVEGLNGLDGIRCPKPGGGTYAFPDIRGTGLSSEEFAKVMLEKAGIALLPGTDFGQYGEGYVRLCFGTSAGVIQKALGKMKEVLDEKGKGQK